MQNSDTLLGNEFIVKVIGNETPDLFLIEYKKEDDEEFTQIESTTESTLIKDLDYGYAYKVKAAYKKHGRVGKFCSAAVSFTICK